MKFKQFARMAAAAAMLAGSLGLAHGAEAPTVAEDPVLEKRVMEIGQELRCLVCQNQTIADSNAGLAVDLKNQVREQLKAGKSQAEIVDYMVQRYGDFVLYRPAFKATTALLWAGPFVLLAGGIAVAVVVVRRRRSMPSPSNQMTEAQRLKAAQLLQDEPETRS
jgi:cytochrome c-type biogenesis protein CcmH